jgi:hypothetical protein
MEKVKYHHYIYINIILEFSENKFYRYNNLNNFEFSNKVLILKKVKSLRQLRRTGKELVRLYYKGAIINGFTLKGIQ